MLRYFILITAFVIATPFAHSAPLVLTASSGTFNAKTLSSPFTKGAISYFVSLPQTNGAVSWPSAAYIGFHQGTDRNNSVQFLVIKNKETDQFLVSGYRVVEGGKEVKSASLANLPLDAKIPVELLFDNGLVLLKAGNTAPVIIQTALTSVSYYVSVTSGTAEFEVNPNPSFKRDAALTRSPLNSEGRGQVQ
jgi:hypothetical protein